jgi:hypothetical protein
MTRGMPVEGDFPRPRRSLGSDRLAEKCLRGLWTECWCCTCRGHGKRSSRSEFSAAAVKIEVDRLPKQYLDTTGIEASQKN